MYFLGLSAYVQNNDYKYQQLDILVEDKYLKQYIIHYQNINIF